MHHRRILTVVAALVAAGSVAGCGDDNSGANSEPGAVSVVATTSIWADVVSNVGCGGIVDVTALIPPGGDPHTFEPSLADRGAMEDAGLVVANGLGLEERLDDTLEAVEDSGGAVFRFSDHVELIEIAEGDEHADEDEHAHDHTGKDPHIWFDPSRVTGTLPALADALVEHAGVERESVDACLADYTTRLETLDEDIAQRLGSVPEDARKLVTNHDALGYLANRYGYEVIGTVIPSPSTLSETNAAQLEQLATTLEDEGVSAVFAEDQHSGADIQALADRVGQVEVVALFTGSLGEAGSGADSYEGLMRTSAESIADALN